MSEHSYDVIIAGAGPAGLSTALKLAGTDLSVALIDKDSFPREKICGDALSASVMNCLKRLLGNIYRDFKDIPDKTPSNGIRFIAPDLNFVDVPFVLDAHPDSPASGYICKRVIFDDFLMKEIRKFSTVTVIQNFRITHAQAGSAGVIISDGNTDLHAKMVIGADGMNSVIGSSFTRNKPDHDHYSLAVRAYFKNVKDLHPLGYIELHFFKELLPGYFWIFPMQNDEVNVGLGMMFKDVRKKKQNLSKTLVDLIEKTPSLNRRFASATMLGKIEGYGLPLGPSKKTISGNRFLLTGDAASLIDPFSGEGIGNAMVSGEVAAHVVKEAFINQDFSGDFLRTYDKLIFRKISHDLRTSSRIQHMAGYSWLFNFVVGKAAKNEDLKKMLTKMYASEDVKSKLMNPLFYVKLLFNY
jgi:geranylgeranyl reductase family protein